VHENHLLVDLLHRPASGSQGPRPVGCTGHAVSQTAASRLEHQTPSHISGTRSRHRSPTSHLGIYPIAWFGDKMKITLIVV